MTPFPAVRLTPQKIFAATGLDYAGPINVTLSRHRGVKSTKGYLVVFICLVTRAVHLEIASNLESVTFLAAFDRFCSRRGQVSVIYSDNGTTFQGAEGEIDKLFEKGSDFQKSIANKIENKGIRWSFIPPRAPHFGGI